MGVTDFRELVAWQLSYQLKCEVWAFTAIGRRPEISNIAIRSATRARRRLGILPKDTGGTILASSQDFAGSRSLHWRRRRTVSSTAAIASISTIDSFQGCGTSPRPPNERRETWPSISGRNAPRRQLERTLGRQVRRTLRVVPRNPSVLHGRTLRFRSPKNPRVLLRANPGVLFRENLRVLVRGNPRVLFP